MAEHLPPVNIEGDIPVNVSVSFGNIFDGIGKSLDDFVAKIKSGSDEAITILTLSVMFVVAGVVIYRAL